jgi:superfamily I DNA/RNA helicase
LSRCGINVKGRSSFLHLNYRTTEETQRYAFAFLKGIPFDDLDGEILEKDKCLSLTHGDAPEVKNFTDFEEQMAYTCDEIRKLLNEGAILNDICIVARGRKQTDAIIGYLEQEGIEHIEVKREEGDSDFVGVRVATMHRIKGLEFRYIFAVCINKDIIPSVSKTADEVENDENLLIERCLLYVALTRAQIKAHVFSYGKESPFLAQ